LAKWHKICLSPFQGCIKLIAFPPGFTRCCYITPLSGLNAKQPTGFARRRFDNFLKVVKSLTRLVLVYFNEDPPASAFIMRVFFATAN
jgi:hypothetical protein